MSFQTFVTERLKAITEALNAIGTNAKKIDELPVQSTLDPASKIHVSKGGTSESLSVQKIIDAVNSGSYDHLIIIGEIIFDEVEVNKIIVPHGAQWKINDIYYSNIANVEIIIPLADTGLTRTDILVADTSNQIVLVQGLETGGIAVRPNIPLNNVLVTEINVTDSEVGTPSLPIVGDSYIPKSEYATLSITDNGVIDLTDNRNRVELIEATYIDCVAHDDSIYLYDGRPLFIKNSTQNNIVLKHLYGYAGWKFSFPNEENFTLKPGEQIQFGLRLTSKIYHFIGIIRNQVGDIEGLELSLEGLELALDTKLDVSSYNQHFKGVYLSEVALNSALPTASIGDYAQVNEVGATDVVNYNWDAEENIWVKNAVAGSSATNTDALPEGSSNIYFTTARVLATLLTGISFATGGAIVSTDSVLVAFGKLQKQITDILTSIGLKQDVLVSGTTIKTIEGQSILGSGNIDITKSDVGLPLADNTSDASKSVLSSTKLTTPRSINGVNFDGTSNITINAVDSIPRIAVSEKAQANGVATLGSDGKVPNNQIPALAISETFSISSQAQMLALSQADQGDVAIRSDISKSFILRQSPSSVLGNWNELLTPTSAVTSVNGQVGVVTLSKSDVGLSNVDNTSDANKPISTATQTALNDKIGGTGTTNYLPKFTGASTLRNSLVGDNAIGVGINPLNTTTGHLKYKFQVRQGLDQNLQFRNSDYGSVGGMLIQASNDSDATSIPLEFGASKFSFNIGNVGINTINPTANLDVNGTFNATGAATFSSSVTATSLKSTDLAGSGDSAIGTDSEGKLKRITSTYSQPYKVYTALISQSGTTISNSDITVLENTLGGTPTWTRQSPGIFLCTLTGAFTANKTAVFALKDTTSPTGTAGVFIRASRFSNDVVYLTVVNSASGGIDGQLLSSSIEIRVYL